MLSRPFKPLTIRKHGLEDEATVSETRPVKRPKLGPQALPNALSTEEESISPVLQRGHVQKLERPPLEPVINPPSSLELRKGESSANIESYHSVLW
jgi:hypothetical protein